MSTAVVIPNWNGAAMLAACLDALASQTSVPTAIVVVDNGSSDGSVALAKAHLCAPEVLELPDNLGFAGGVNVGLSWCLDRDFDFVALLNNDAEPEPSWLAELQDEIVRHPRAAAVASTMVLRRDGEELLNSTGEMVSSWGLPYARGYLEVDEGQYSDSVDIAAASGGASIYRVGALRQVGLFHAPYFAYFEDVDLCLRARLRGWEVRYRPSARVLHQVGGTSARVPGFRDFQTLRNSLVLPLRTFPLPLLARTAPRLLWSSLRSSAGLVRKGNARLVLRAWASLARMLPSLLRDRHALQSSATLPRGAWRQWISPGRPPLLAAGGTAARTADNLDTP